MIHSGYLISLTELWNAGSKRIFGRFRRGTEDILCTRPPDRLPEAVRTRREDVGRGLAIKVFRQIP